MRLGVLPSQTGKSGPKGLNAYKRKGRLYRGLTSTAIIFRSFGAKKTACAEAPSMILKIREICVIGKS